MIRPLSLILVLFPAVASAQWLPLEVGNRWEFVTILDPPFSPPDTVGMGVIEVTSYAAGYAVLNGPLAGADSVRWFDGRLFGLIEGKEHLLLDFQAPDGARYSLPMVSQGGALDSIDVTVSRGASREWNGGHDVLQTPAGFFDAHFEFTGTPRATFDAGWRYVVSSGVGPISWLDGQGSLGLLSSLTVLGREYAELDATLTTDKAAYEYGEPIRVTLRVQNRRSEEQRLSTFCNAPLYVVGSIAPHFQACVTYTHPVVFPPGSWREWTWTHDPRVMGLGDGPHTLSGFYGHVGATTTFDAPRFDGGWLMVHIEPFLPQATEQAIKDDLRVQVVQTHPLTGGGRSEIWAVTEVSIEEAMRRHGAQTGLNLEDSRLMHWTEVTSTEAEREPERPWLQALSAYPNPARNMIRIDGLPAGARVEIYDATGRRVMSGGATLSTHRLPAGLYFYRTEQRAGTFLVVR